VERGLDPREFALLAFGGAGPMLGPMLAREMGIATTVIPQVPAAFSAFGMLMTDLQHEFSATILRPLDEDTLSHFGPVIDAFTEQGHAALLAQEVKESDRRLTRSLDVRYRGQEHALAIEVRDEDTAADIERRFHELHRIRHGHAMPEPAEILTLRVRATGRLPKPALPPIARASQPVAPSGTRAAFDVATGRLTDFPVYQRRELLAGHRLNGPAIVEEGTATTVLFGDQQLSVDGFGHLLITTTAALQEGSR
jgi:N-methylhydantoinase A